MIWRCGNHTFDFDATPVQSLTDPVDWNAVTARRTRVMGILNVTPDSFSDGGENFRVDDAVRRGIEMASQGADIIDIGGESTRPYSEPVDAPEEIRRVVPVIERLSREVDTPISIDTSKASVAEAAIQAGASIINDVTGLSGDADMIDVAAGCDVGVCAMHMLGTPQTMQDDPQYDDVVAQIRAYLAERLETLINRGIDEDRICLDPGIGFGKTHRHNVELLRSAGQFREIGRPILIGHSRKGFTAKILSHANDAGDQATRRDAVTLGITLAMASAGIEVVRVHEVRRTVEALRGWAACQ